MKKFKSLWDQIPTLSVTFSGTVFYAVWLILIGILSVYYTNSNQWEPAIYFLIMFVAVYQATKKPKRIRWVDGTGTLINPSQINYVEELEDGRVRIKTGETAFIVNESYEKVCKLVQG